MPSQEKQLTEKEQKDLIFFLSRKQQLKDSRTNSGIETIWRQADADYEPHELGVKNKKILVENERTEVSTYVNLAKDQWRSKQANNDPYIKIQTAIAILFDRNPEGIFDPAGRKYEASTAFIEQLYHRTWSDSRIGSKKQLRQFIFNLSKYGWASARRYYRYDVRKDVQVMADFNVRENKFETKKKDIVDFDDVYFENLRVWDAWIDDMSKPDDPLSRRDWMWRKTLDKITFETLLSSVESKFSADSFSFSGKIEVDSEQSKTTTREKEKITSENLIEVYFYENRQLNKLIIEAQGKLISSTPLPREEENIELSLVDTYWTMRSDDSPYGIGLNEIMRNSKVMRDRVRNMTIDQVVLSIYKMFFYSNAEQLDDEGGESITVEPGKGKKVLDPKNITWFDVPGPGQDSYKLLDMLADDIEDDTGITKTLEGEITGKTAFEISQAQQGALKRLSTPMRNIKAALEWDALLTVGLMQMVYSIPKVYQLSDLDLVIEYIASVNDDPERYFVDDDGMFNALEYREFQLSLEQGEDGFVSTDKKEFFMAKPSLLRWAGQITIRVESMIEMSKPLERQTKLEMSNILLPLIGQMAVNPSFVEIYIKPVKQILKLYNENPRDWLPDVWLAGQQMQGQLMNEMAQPGQQPPGVAETMGAATVVPPSELGEQAGAGPVQSLSQSISPI